MNIHVTLRYRGVEYDYYDSFGEPHPVFGTVAPDPIRAARYMYTEGNYACDCNRSLFIARNCDASFADWDGRDEDGVMPCGHQITLVSLEADGHSILFEDDPSVRLRAMGLWVPGKAVTA